MKDNLSLWMYQCQIDLDLFIRQILSWFRIWNYSSIVV